MGEGSSSSEFLALDQVIDRYIQERRSCVEGFVREYFSWKEVMALQQASVWRDLFCYPVNMLWAIPYLALRKIVEGLDKIGLDSIQAWFNHVPPRIPTAYQKTIERALAKDLLEWPYVISASGSERHALLEDLRANPKLAILFSSGSGSGPLILPTREISQLMEQYSLGRVYASDLTASAIILIGSWVFFKERFITLECRPTFCVREEPWKSLVRDVST